MLNLAVPPPSIDDRPRRRSVERENAMRTLPLILLAVLAAPAAATAQPYDNYPVCLRIYGPVRYDQCRYTSIEQCRPSAQGIAGQCVTNPWYQPPAEPTRRHRAR
ncbi:hypothetical protein RPD_2861 [Rhodopseudomonas palustris BisB5]|uniref:DUF3551 domain-containing protein n=1 Tax=Rhodopseudomonas palustris (strain BisB5) TaxID=316057 RepID=Q136A0_RHOPS|nr:hypothetical protein RPD_2861 [Rhodopseudomonas palustris BisB5]